MLEGVPMSASSDEVNIRSDWTKSVTERKTSVGTKKRLSDLSVYANRAICHANSGRIG